MKDGDGTRCMPSLSKNILKKGFCHIPKTLLGLGSKHLKTALVESVKHEDGNFFKAIRAQSVITRILNTTQSYLCLNPEHEMGH